jgi:nicotinate-nucleotide--dimethylbenzimidazole phosphoribosyltransferase
MERAYLQNQLQQIIDCKTKPRGSLGLLEKIALQAGVVLQSLSPELRNPHILVFAADHGIASTGLVNPFPQAVTAQMVLNFLNGGAAINVFCRQHEIGLRVIDAGVNFDFRSVATDMLIHAKVKCGTSNYLNENAMTRAQVEECISRGRDVVRQVRIAADTNCIGIGEMGIGNTSSAALIMSSVTGFPLSRCVGRGTGTSDKQFDTKRATLEKVYSFHALHTRNLPPLELLSRIGGFEIAMMTGAYLQAAAEKMLIVVDGFISSAALLVAVQLEPAVLDNCVFAHTSGETGHTVMLNHLRATPLLNIGLRLGEGTGAALAIPLIMSAVNFLNQMATFQSASVSSATL